MRTTFLAHCSIINQSIMLVEVWVTPKTELSSPFYYFYVFVGTIYVLDQSLFNKQRVHLESSREGPGTVDRPSIFAVEPSCRDV